MPTYGTKVPCEEHICALPEAIIQKGKARVLILIPDRDIFYFTISFLTLPSLYFTMFTPLVGAVNR